MQSYWLAFYGLPMSLQPVQIFVTSLVAHEVIEWDNNSLPTVIQVKPSHSLSGTFSKMSDCDTDLLKSRSWLDVFSVHFLLSLMPLVKE